MESLYETPKYRIFYKLDPKDNEQFIEGIFTYEEAKHFVDIYNQFFVGITHWMKAI